MSVAFYNDALDFYNQLSEKKEELKSLRTNRVLLKYKLKPLYEEYDRILKVYESNLRKDEIIAEYDKLSEMHFKSIVASMGEPMNYALRTEMLNSIWQYTFGEPIKVAIGDEYEQYFCETPKEVLDFDEMCREKGILNAAGTPQEESWIARKDELDPEIVDAATRVYRRIAELEAKTELIFGIAPVDKMLDGIKSEYGIFELEYKIDQLEQQLGLDEHNILRLEYEIETQRLAYESEHADDLITKRAAWNQLSREERIERMLVPNEGESEQECLERVFSEKTHLCKATARSREKDNDCVGLDYIIIDRDPDRFEESTVMFDEKPMSATYEKRWLAEALVPIHIQAVQYAKQKVDPDAKRGEEFMEGTPKPYGKRFVNDYAKFICDWLKDTQAQTKLYHDFQKNCVYMAAFGDLVADILDLVDVFGVDGLGEKHKNFNVLKFISCEGMMPLTYPYFKKFVKEDGSTPSVMDDLYKDPFSTYKNPEFFEIRAIRDLKDFTTALANLLIWNNCDMFHFGLKTQFNGVQFHRYYDFYEERTGKPNLMPGEEGYAEFMQEQLNYWGSRTDGFGYGHNDGQIPYNIYIIFKEYLSWVDFYRAPNFFSRCHDMIFDYAKDFKNHLIFEDEVVESIKELKARCFPYNKLEEIDISFLIPDLLFIETSEWLADGDMVEMGLF